MEKSENSKSYREMAYTRSSLLTGTVWPASSTGTPFTNRPSLGPTMAAPTKATVPPRT